ncbi:MAG: dTDP-4-dehydrorhamnose reductase [Deltaproteobacteria bacterium]|nr:dTDP-4-dehydrorhamnose reductase [Deltaproteobacteria bacterium]
MSATGTQRRVLIFGGSGLLGHALRAHLEGSGVEVHAPSRSEAELGSLETLRAAVARARPSQIVNLAAQAKVDAAEEDPDQAFRVNALGAQHCALVAAEADLPLVHVSTDYVFDGALGRPLREVDPTGLPPNQYGQSKLLGERLVRETWRRHFIVRVAGLFGPGRSGFVDWVVAQARPERPLTIVADRFVTPTYTVDLARQLAVLADTPYYGTYHAAGRRPASWYELACAALRAAGRDPAGVRPIPDAELPSRVRRPVYSALDNHLLRLRGLETLRGWDEGIVEYLRPA